jgi:hypothetical protein
LKGKNRGIAAALGASLIAAVAATVACIPDLPGDEPPPPPGCGDGFIALDAGEQCDPGLPLSTGGCTSDCKMQCNGLVWSQNNHCYELAPQTTAIVTTAIGDCSALANAHVVTFASEEEFRNVADYFHGMDAGLFWVGIENGNTLAQFAPEPGWTTTCPGCYAHSFDQTLPLPRLDASTPDGAPVREACIAASSDTHVETWEQYPCAGPAPRLQVLCEREPVGRQSRPCAPGICVDLVLTHEAKRYAYVPVPATADAAEQGCVALGGHLAVLRSRDEREQLWLQLSRLDAVPSSIWIGLSLQDAGAAAGGDGAAPAWLWDDGTAAILYPPVWGSALAPIAMPPVHARAFLWNRGTMFADDTLAHNDQATLMTMPYVCDLPVGDAGP